MAWSHDIALEVLGEFVDVGRYGTYDTTIAPRVVVDITVVRERRRAIGLCVFCGAQNEESAARIARELTTKQLEFHFPSLRRAPRCADCRAAARERKRLTRVQARAARTQMRQRLSDLRSGITHHFVLTVKCVKCERRGELRPDCSRCAGEGTYELDGYLRTGCYEDGRLGEIFLTVGKVGDRYTVYDSLCKVFSGLLQYGAPLRDACNMLIGVSNELSGPTKNKTIPRCASIEDYIGRFLLLKYGSDEDKKRMREIAGGGGEL